MLKIKMIPVIPYALRAKFFKTGILILGHRASGSKSNLYMCS